MNGSVTICDCVNEIKDEIVGGFNEVTGILAFFCYFHMASHSPIGRGRAGA